MLDVVIEGITIPDALQRHSGSKRNDLSQARMGGPEPILHIGGQERAKGFCRQFGQCDHVRTTSVEASAVL